MSIADLDLEDDELEAKNGARRENRENFYRLRSNRTMRAMRRSKRPAGPGSIRLRRNKHWSW